MVVSTAHMVGHDGGGTAFTHAHLQPVEEGNNTEHAGVRGDRAPRLAGSQGIHIQLVLPKQKRAQAS